MRAGRVARTVGLITLGCLALLILSAVLPAPAHASTGTLLAIPGWLQDAIDSLMTTIVKTLQDTARLGGVLLWGILKLCGMVALFAQDFSALFGNVITEALNAIMAGSVHQVIRGSLMVSLGLFGLSLIAKPFWPDLKLVSFQRIVLWGVVIQAFLLNAPNIYTTLETFRVDLAEEIASAVSSGAIPGCSGGVVDQLLCITGTSAADVLDPSLTILPDGIPYGGTESVRDLYDHCVYNPPVLYSSPACDPDNPVGDPWEVLTYAQDALGTQLLGLVIAFLLLAYGALQICLGLAAGMMFVLFPVAAIFAFYLPLESFPAGVIRNYITIFLKSVVLLTLAAVVIRLFSVATGSLTAMAAVALVDLLLCLVMAKEALSSLLSSISFVGQSVGSIGASLGLSGGGGGGAALPSPESRVAASMIGGGAVGQTLMGAPNPYLAGSGGGIIGAAGHALGAPVQGARAAVQAAMAATTGGAGAVVGALAASRGADYGSLALMGNATTTILGQDAGKGFMTGAGVMASVQTLRGGSRGAGSRSGGSSTSGSTGTAGTSPATPSSGPTPTQPSPTQPRPGGGAAASSIGSPPATPAPGTPQPSSAQPRTGGTSSSASQPGVSPAGSAARPSGSGIAQGAQNAPGGQTQVIPGGASPAGTQSPLLVPVPPSAQSGSSGASTSSVPAIAPADPWTGAPMSTAPLQALLLADGSSATPDPDALPQPPADTQPQELSGWAPQSARQIRDAAAKLQPASPDVENAAYDLARAGHAQAVQWTADGRSPVLPDGSLDPQFVEEVVQREPEAATVLSQEQAALPPEQRLSVGEAAALGVTTERTLPPRQVRQGFAHAVKAAGTDGNLDSALRAELGAGTEHVFGPHAGRAQAVVRQMQDAGLASEMGRQLVETVGESVEQNPRLTAQQFPEGRLERMRQWDAATGDPETTDRIVEGLIGLGAAPQVTLREIPRSAEPRPPMPGRSPRTEGPGTTEPDTALVEEALRPAADDWAPLPGAAPADLPGPVPLPTLDAAGHVPPFAGAPGTAAEPAVHTQEVPTGSIPGTDTASAIPGEAYDPVLFARLRAWRQEAARQAGQKAFHVFPDATLKRIAAARPQTLEDLGAIKGVGPRKIEQYGQDVLDTIHRGEETE
jgi:hypothetical protein